MFAGLISRLADATATACTPHTFLGLVPWYQYLKLDSTCAIQDFNVLPKDGQGSDFPLILLAVVDDLLRVAGLLAVLFVIYGGITYATSQGEPDKAKQAQTTILSALLGLAISLVAVAFVSFIGARLG